MSFIVVISIINIYITFCQQRDGISSDSTCIGSVVTFIEIGVEAIIQIHQHGAFKYMYSQSDEVSCSGATV